VFRPPPPARERVVGVFARERDGGGIVHPTDRRDRLEYRVMARDIGDAGDGDLVVAEPVAASRTGPPRARIVERLGRLEDPLAPSLVAIREHGIPVAFSAEALAEAEAAEPVDLGSRSDLRDLPLVTIDGEDARDFDDAVWAEPDGEGWHAVVAIADVAWYVRDGGALDRDAAERGNSVYFPDRVVPMLPEALSNELCSLKPNVERACLAIHLWIGSDGRLVRHRVVRGLMRSVARLTYEQAQARMDAGGDAIVSPLYGAYRTLEKWRLERGALDLDIPEFRVTLAPDGTPLEIGRRARLDSHRLIEELMIAANVAAAETLGAKNIPCMYRVHDQPDAEKLASLSMLLEEIGAPGLKLARGQVVRPQQFARILEAAEGRAEAPLIHQLVLRSQAQAAYSPNNIGHFGLGLRHYAHFTSPIRRYADLLVHRALIQALGLGEGGAVAGDAATFEALGKQISDTERRAARAERDTVDRYVARFMRDHIGAVFTGRISGIARFGLFVTLADTGADGMIPIATLPADYYQHDKQRHALTGRRTGTTYRLGQSVQVRLAQHDPIGAGLIFALIEGPPKAARGKQSRNALRSGARNAGI
jgi:ribonuclease R